MNEIAKKQFELIKDFCILQEDGSYLIKKSTTIELEVGNSYKIKIKNNILNQTVLTVNYNNNFIPPTDKLYNIEVVKRNNNLLIINGIAEDFTTPLFNYTVHVDTIDVISKL